MSVFVGWLLCSASEDPRLKLFTLIGSTMRKSLYSLTHRGLSCEDLVGPSNSFGSPRVFFFRWFIAKHIIQIVFTYRGKQTAGSYTEQKGGLVCFQCGLRHPFKIAISIFLRMIKESRPFRRCAAWSNSCRIDSHYSPFKRNIGFKWASDLIFQLPPFSCKTQ